jgi:hypothetical protein
MQNGKERIENMLAYNSELQFPILLQLDFAAEINVIMTSVPIFITSIL